MKEVNKLDDSKYIIDKILEMEKEIIDLVVAPYTNPERNKAINEVLQIVYKYKKEIYDNVDY